MEEKNKKKLGRKIVLIILIILVGYFIINLLLKNSSDKFSPEEIQTLIENYSSQLDSVYLQPYYVIEGENWDGNDLVVKFAHTGPVGNYTFFEKRTLDVIFPHDQKGCYAIGGVWKINEKECKVELEDSMIRENEVFVIAGSKKYTIPREYLSVKNSFKVELDNIDISLNLVGTIFYNVVLRVVCIDGEEVCQEGELFVCKKQSFSLISFGELIEGEKTFLENTEKIC